MSGGVQTRATKALAVNMTDNNTDASMGEQKEQVSLTSIMAKLNEMDAKHQKARKTLEEKIDKLRSELNDDIDKRLKTFSDDINKSLESIETDYKSLRADLQTAQNRLTEIENRNKHEDYEPVDDVDKTIVLANLREPSDDTITLDDTVNQLIEALGDSVYQEVNVVQTKRLPGRENKPGLVKVALDSRESKIKVLQSKKELKDNESFKKVWIRTSKTHAERVAEMNFKKILQLVPGGEKLRISGNGKIIDYDSGGDGMARATGFSRGGRGGYRGRGGDPNRRGTYSTATRGSGRGGGPQA